VVITFLAKHTASFNLSPSTSFGYISLPATACPAPAARQLRMIRAFIGDATICMERQRMK
jgi:hypothetical protein